MTPRIAAIIPTYNEVELLAACVQSIASQNIPNLHIIVVNAGDPLPEALVDSIAEEHKVPNDFFWTACMFEGVNLAKELNADYCLFTNADTQFLPDSISKLLKAVEGQTRTIACSPAYVPTENGELRLLYSDQSDLGPLLYGKILRRWEKPADAPVEPFDIQLTGGQGVLIPMSLFEAAQVDVERMPHYASDHDLWLQARKLGYRLLLVPQAGIVNHRDFNDKKERSESLARSLWRRMTSVYTPESWPLMWRLRRKHQGPIIGLATTLVSFGLRWTIGLPKIIRRS